MSAGFAGRVKLRRARAVAVATANAGAFVCYRTCFCHNVSYGSIMVFVCNMDYLFIIGILILSVVIHEVSHGYVAEMLGDPTARMAGRLTLNPLKHLDPLGSIIIPALLVITNAGILFGWAKPVPYNPYNLRNGRWGEAMVAGAGPLTNIFLAAVFGLLVRLGPTLGLPASFIELSSMIVYINIILAVFNMIPVPPLDGSKVLASILPHNLYFYFMRFQDFMVHYGMLAMVGFLLLFIYFLWPFFFTFIQFLFYLATGTHFS